MLCVFSITLNRIVLHQCIKVVIFSNNLPKKSRSHTNSTITFQEAVQKSEHELESQVEKLREEKSHAESRQRELEQRVFSLMEREKKIMEDNQHQVDKAAELNGTLRRQLDEKCHEVTELNNRFTKEVI